MNNRVLFLSDLDNTLLFSYQHRLPEDVCLEHLDGREQGFTTPEAWTALGSLPENVVLVPVTTRSVEQYRRLRWPKDPDWAVTTNGGILLGPQGPDPDWLEASRRLAEPYQKDLARAYDALGGESWCLRRRMVDGLYLFAVCGGGADPSACGTGFRQAGPLTAAASGRKLYFFPPGLHKGAAVDALRQRFQPAHLVCAGDSPLDLPMLALAGTALVPNDALARQLQGPRVRVCPDDLRFPDFVLREVRNLARLPV